MLTESEVMGVGAAQQVLNGKHYNRAVRCHQLVLDALMRLRMKAFMDSLPEDDKEKVSTLLNRIAGRMQQGISEDVVTELKADGNLKSTMARVDICFASAGPTVQFWLSYMEMASLLLLFITSTREADWELHLECIRGMLPYFFAYDHQNYSRYVSYYWASMSALAQTHPTAAQELKGGEFGVQRNPKVQHQIPMDMTIEQTINRDTKTHGGIIGFSRSSRAVQKWIATAHQRAEMTRNCRQMAGEAASKERLHKDASTARMKQDEADVLAIVTTIESWGNPFTLRYSGLVNISTGKAKLH